MFIFLFSHFLNIGSELLHLTTYLEFSWTINVMSQTCFLPNYCHFQEFCSETFLQENLNRSTILNNWASNKNIDTLGFKTQNNREVLWCFVQAESNITKWNRLLIIPCLNYPARLPLECLQRVFQQTQSQHLLWTWRELTFYFRCFKVVAEMTCYIIIMNYNAIAFMHFWFAIQVTYLSPFLFRALTANSSFTSTPNVCLCIIRSICPTGMSQMTSHN